MSEEVIYHINPEIPAPAIFYANIVMEDSDTPYVYCKPYLRTMRSGDYSNSIARMHLRAYEDDKTYDDAVVHVTKGFIELLEDKWYWDKTFIVRSKKVVSESGNHWIRLSICDEDDLELLDAAGIDTTFCVGI